MDGVSDMIEDSISQTVTSYLISGIKLDGFTKMLNAANPTMRLTILRLTTYPFG